MLKLIIILICCFPLVLFGQTQDNTKKQNNDTIPAWLTELAEKGYEINEDSLIVSDEFLKVLNDSNYSALLYPKTYTWTQATRFIDTQELKKAFWFFVNLYPENETNKKIVVRSILAYEKVFKMDEVIVNTFYTYSFMDPEVSEIIDGKPEITRPDIMESKLRDVKEIVEYIHIYREQQEKESVKE
ncbi:MAG: hypothetical protein GQ525_04760 [Draconibacterium sp.]|nr:hypothetical protein [Draconibacterium sp.]